MHHAHAHLSTSLRYPPSTVRENLVEKHREEWSAETSLFWSRAWVLFSFFRSNRLVVNFAPL